MCFALFRNKRAGLFLPAILKHHPENSGRLADSHFASFNGLVVRRFKGLKQFPLVVRIFIPLQVNAFGFEDEKPSIPPSAGDEIRIDPLPSPSLEMILLPCGDFVPLGDGVALVQIQREIFFESIEMAFIHGFKKTLLY